MIIISCFLINSWSTIRNKCFHRNLRHVYFNPNFSWKSESTIHIFHMSTCNTKFLFHFWLLVNTKNPLNDKTFCSILIPIKSVNYLATFTRTISWYFSINIPMTSFAHSWYDSYFCSCPYAIIINVILYVFKYVFSCPTFKDYVLILRY